VHYPAYHAPVVGALDTTHILRQMRLNPRPLFVAQPEEISAHQILPQYESVSYCSNRKINEF